MCCQTWPNYPKQQVFYFPAISSKKLSDVVDFLHAGKHETLLQIDSMILIGMLKHSKCSQNSKFALYLQYLKKEVKVKVYFLYADKHQSFQENCFSTLGNAKYSDILQG